MGGSSHVCFYISIIKYVYDPLFKIVLILLLYIVMFELNCHPPDKNFYYIIWSFYVYLLNL